MSGSGGGGMCLGAVAQVVRVDDDGHVEVRSERGVERALSVMMAGTLTPGDWVMVHTGLIYATLTESEAREVLRIRELGLRAVS